MKKEAKILLDKSIDSLILAVEHFNRPWDCGRKESVLILMDHSFELLLKSAILNKNHKIRDPRRKETFGFDKCVRVALSEKIISEDQIFTLQAINSLRDAAQHYFVELSEQHFYFQAQSGLTIYKDILQNNFDKNCLDKLPKRVLPLATMALTDINTFFENEVEEVKKMLSPGKRRKVEAASILRGLAIFDSAIQGEKLQPSDGEITKLASSIKSGRSFEEIFPGISSINISGTVEGPSVSLRLTKKEGTPVQLVKEGTPGATVVAVKRVNELDYYSSNLTDLAKKVGLTSPKALSVIRHMKLTEDPEYYKEIKIGSVTYKRYSPKAVSKIRKELPTLDMDEIWRLNRPGRKKTTNLVLNSV